MAIEIRELVVKATVNKTLDSQNQYLTKADLPRLQDRIAEKVLKKVKAVLEEGRSSR